ncbi:hypothetical protein L596_007377 [Steinernema carpocapsae]|uniref:Ribosomal RNA-processing protein 7 C-terminal domain-containing protein n=1 Tax=Steinernema carpocapsae TaxID=34508 RepID=A0A4U5P961_STECR|nr:hypothetical protein L596_007377 [Steinernema carpocapsae]
MTSAVLNYSVSNEFSCTRQIFLKSDKSNESSLIVGNIPPFVSLDAIKSMIILTEPKAKIHSANFKSSTSLDEDIQKGYRTASVNVGTERSVQKILKSAESLPVINLHALGHPLPRVGMRKFTEDYSKKLKTVEELEMDVETYMSDYDAKVAQRKMEAKLKGNKPDEDGWVTVTRTKRHAATDQQIIKNSELIDRVKRRKVVADEEAVAFYTFKSKESKAKHMDELRRKFEEDKKRIALAKAARKFNPV